MRSMAKATLVLLALGFFAAPLQAQMLEGQALGDAYLSFDQAAYVPVTEAPIPAFQSFNWFLVFEIDYTDIGLPEATNAGNGLKGWEFGVTVPASITVTNRVLAPTTSLNLGGPDDWIVGTGQLVAANSTPFAVVTYTGLLLADASDVVVDYKDVSISSFDPVAAGWNEFANTNECFRISGGNQVFQACLRKFVNVNRMVINCVAEPECNIPIEEHSWGSVKSRF